MATALHSSGRPVTAISNQFAAQHDAVVALFDRAVVELTRLDASGMEAFMVRLNEIRLACRAGDWEDLMAQTIASHPLRALLHQEPLTRRAFEKPRGYPGDAVLLDLIYRNLPYTEPMTPVAACVHAWAPSCQAFRSVRERRELLANLIDRTAGDRALPRILSLACGHLREAQRSHAIQADAVGEILAVDQDPLSLEVLVRELHNPRITPVNASIRGFLVDPTIYGDFDLVYSAGLYDYLDDETARRLTTSMFAALRPGGSLVVANFAPELPDIGYMEAIMDWRLIYRDERGVAAFCDDLPADLIRDQRMQRDSGGNVIYLTVRKC